MTTRAFDTHMIHRVVYANADCDIVAWIVRPSPARGRLPVVVYNHDSRIAADGTAELRRPTFSYDSDPWPGVLAGSHILFMPEGRGYAGSTGPKLTHCRSEADILTFLEGRVSDVGVGLGHLIKTPYADRSRVAITGCGHGAVVSLLAAPQGHYRAVIAQAPGVWAGNPEAGLPAMVKALSRTQCPVLLQHATGDGLCDISISRALARQSGAHGPPVALKIYEHLPDTDGHDLFAMDHCDVWGPDFDTALDPVVGASASVVSPRAN